MEWRCVSFPYVEGRKVLEGVSFLAATKAEAGSAPSRKTVTCSPARYAMPSAATGPWTSKSSRPHGRPYFAPHPKAAEDLNAPFAKGATDIFEGERGRIAIALSFLADRRILILDEMPRGWTRAPRRKYRPRSRIAYSRSAGPPVPYPRRGRRPRSRIRKSRTAHGTRRRLPRNILEPSGALPDPEGGEDLSPSSTGP